MKNKKTLPNEFHLYIQTKYKMLITPNKKQKKEKLEKKYKKYLTQDF